MVNALIAARAAVDRADSLGFTALIYAAQEGFDAIVDCLIRVAGASVHHVNFEGRTVLHMATQLGRVGVVRLLLRAGANPNIVSTDGMRATPIYIATQNGHLAILEALIEVGANVNHIMANGTTSLMLAANEDRIDIVRALLAAGADPLIAITEAGPFNGSTALDVAKALNHSAIIALLEARLAELAAAGSP